MVLVDRPAGSWESGTRTPLALSNSPAIAARFPRYLKIFHGRQSARQFADYRLEVGGLVETPGSGSSV